MSAVARHASASLDADADAALDRLEGVFGAEPIRSLCAGLVETLEQALAALDRGEAAGIAHRVAGSAGTLGFASTSRAWQAVSEGDRSADEAARTETRRALSTLAERDNRRSRQTSV